MGGKIFKIAKKTYTEFATENIEYFSKKDITTEAYGQILEKAEEGIVFGKAEEPNLKELAIVNKAYFAVIKIIEVYDNTTIEHIVSVTSKSASLSSIAKEYADVDWKAIQKENNMGNSTTVHPKQVLKITTKKLKGKKLVFEKINSAQLGEEVYVIVETSGLQGKEIITYIMQGKEKAIADKGSPLSLMVGDKEDTLLKTNVGAFSIDEDILNKNKFKNSSIGKVTLQPKGEKKIKEWYAKLSKLATKKAYLYLLVDAHSDGANLNIEYCGFKEDGKEKDQGGFKNCFLDRDGSWFELLSRQVCPIDPSYRSHFVIHCTAGEMTEKSIKSKTKFDNPKKKKRSAAHIYVNKDGSKLEIWPLTEKNVWATKIESKKGLKGQMFHIELNYGAPSVPSEAMYKTLADLYIEASDIEECWPIIVPHIEIDRGIADGHQDPTGFDYNHFYSILKGKGIPIDDIPKFDHNRYWEKDIYKIPWSSDKTNWPPILKGNPHK